jgi:glycosyltransferase involved in cell wall biosynthesis
MRILIVSEMSVPYTSGGGETRYALLAAQLAQRGHAVTWLSMHQRASPAEEVLAGVRHLHRGPRLHAPPERSLWHKLRFMFSVVGHLLRHRYDVVDTQTYAPLPAAWLGCRLTGQPLVATIHDTAGAAPDQWFSANDRWLATLVERRLYRLPYDHVLTVGRAVRDDLVGRFGLVATRVSAIPNGVDVEGIAKTDPHTQACDLLFVGRLIPHKHPELFLDVAAAVNAKRREAGLPPLRLKLVGGGPLLETMQARANALGLTHWLAWGEAAQHHEVVAHIRSARVLLLPSTREGFGLVLAEAMAAGTAVVVTDIPALRETLGPTLCGALVPPGDTAAFADRVNELLNDADLHAARVEAGRTRVASNFSLAAFTSQVEAVYQRAVKAHAA